jgi:hypothetical protein
MKKKYKKIVSITFLILFIIINICLWKNYYNPPKLDNLKIVSIQPEGKQILPLLQSQHNIDIMILPEYAIPVDISRNTKAFELLSGIARDKNCYIVFGYIEQTKNKKYNVIGCISPNGKLEYKHYKIHLIPIAEYDISHSKENQNIFTFEFDRQYSAGIITCLDIHHPDIIASFKNEVDFFIIPNLIRPEWGKRPVYDMIRSAKFLSVKYNRKVIVAGEYDPTITIP